MPHYLFALGLIFSLLTGFFFGYGWGMAGVCFIIGLQVFWPKVLGFFSPNLRRRMKEIHNSIADETMFAMLMADDPEYGPDAYALSQRIQAKANDPAPMFKSRRNVADTPETMSIMRFRLIPRRLHLKMR